MGCERHRQLEYITNDGACIGWIQRRGDYPSERDAVNALLAFIDENGEEGRLHSGRLSTCSARTPPIKEIIDKAGGIWQFCERHRELRAIAWGRNAHFWGR